MDLDWYTTRERGYDEVLPWDHLDSGLDRDWLWQDWQDAIDPAGAAEVDDCRWTPCFECGVCPAMGTEIETGPTGAKLLPLEIVRKRAADDPARSLLGRPPRLSPRDSSSGTLKEAGCVSRVTGISRARLSGGSARAQLPIAYSAGFSPHPRISYVGGSADGNCERGRVPRTRPYRAVGRRAGAGRLGAALPAGIDVVDVFDLADAPLPGPVGREQDPGRAQAPGSGAPPAGRLGALRLEASRWEVVVPGVTPAAAASAVAEFLAAASWRSSG